MIDVPVLGQKSALGRYRILYKARPEAQWGSRGIEKHVDEPTRTHAMLAARVLMRAEGKSASTWKMAFIEKWDASTGWWYACERGDEW